MCSERNAQAFTNCVYGYDCVPNVHANNVTRTQNSCMLLIPLFKNNWNLSISNMVVLNPYSRSAAFDPQSFAPLS